MDKLWLLIKSKGDIIFEAGEKKRKKECLIVLTILHYLH